MSTPNEPSGNGDLDAFSDFMKGHKPEPPKPSPEGPDGQGSQDEGPSEAEEIRKALIRAIGDLSLICNQCGKFCDEHGHKVKVRDRVMLRARKLSERFIEGLDLYLQQREWGVESPGELVARIYGIWAEMSLLLDAAEYQKFMDEEDDEDYVVGEDADWE